LFGHSFNSLCGLTGQQTPHQSSLQLSIICLPASVIRTRRDIVPFFMSLFLFLRKQRALLPYCG
jgi:hypothetical protein